MQWELFKDGIRVCLRVLEKRNEFVINNLYI